MTEMQMERTVPEAIDHAYRLKQHGHGLCLVGLFFIGYGLWLAWPPSLESLAWDASDMEYLWHALLEFLMLASLPCAVGLWSGLAGIGLLQRQSWGRLALCGFSSLVWLTAAGGWGYAAGYAMAHRDAVALCWLNHLNFGVLFGGLIVCARSLLKYAESDEVRMLCGEFGEPAPLLNWPVLQSAALLCLLGALVWGYRIGATGLL